LAPGIIGSICVGAVGLRSTGCIVIGPVAPRSGCFLGMTVNAQPSTSFEGDIWRQASIAVAGCMAHGRAANPVLVLRGADAA